MRESTLWMLNLVAGAVILVLLGVHMAIMHLDTVLGYIGLASGGTVEASAVFARSKQALFMTTYIILLGAALYHGLYGLRKILFELTLSKGAEKFTDWFLTVAGLALFIYGSYVAVAVFLS